MPEESQYPEESKEAFLKRMAGKKTAGPQLGGRLSEIAKLRPAYASRSKDASALAQMKPKTGGVFQGMKSAAQRFMSRFKR